MDTGYWPNVVEIKKEKQSHNTPLEAQGGEDL
jgi:hypothetical protein